MSPKFNDIVRLPEAHYEIDVSWDRMEWALENFHQDYSLEMNPDFQRAHVWTREQQIAYVEWILKGGETGKTVFFNCPGWQGSRDVGKMVLVDGKQRLEAVRAFMHNEIPAFGHLFKEYTDRLRSVLIGFKFRIAALDTRADVLRWYLAINAGGTPHTSDELDRVRKLLEEEEAKQ